MHALWAAGVPPCARCWGRQRVHAIPLPSHCMPAARRFPSWGDWAGATAHLLVRHGRPSRSRRSMQCRALVLLLFQPRATQLKSMGGRAWAAGSGRMGAGCWGILACCSTVSAPACRDGPPLASWLQLSTARRSLSTGWAHAVCFAHPGGANGPGPARRGVPTLHPALELPQRDCHCRCADALHHRK